MVHVPRGRGWDFIMLLRKVCNFKHESFISGIFFYLIPLDHDQLQVTENMDSKSTSKGILSHTSFLIPLFLTPTPFFLLLSFFTWSSSLTYRGQDYYFFCTLDYIRKNSFSFTLWLSDGIFHWAWIGRQINRKARNPEIQCFISTQSPNKMSSRITRTKNALTVNSEIYI